MPLNPPPPSSMQSFDTTTTTPSLNPPPPPPPAGANPAALSHNGVVNFEALKRDRERTEAKYKTHLPTTDSKNSDKPKKDDGEELKKKTYSEEDKGLLDAVKGVGEALHLSGKPGGK